MRGKLSAAASQQRQMESEVANFCAMVDGLVENLLCNRVVNFGNFIFVGRFQKSISVLFV